PLDDDDSHSKVRAVDRPLPKHFLDPRNFDYPQMHESPLSRELPPAAVPGVVGTTAPDFEFGDWEGRLRTLSSLRSRPAIVAFLSSRSHSRSSDYARQGLACSGVRASPIRGGGLS